MNKLFGACLLFSLIATTAMAWPNVGDDARYTLTTTGVPYPVTGQSELTITGIKPSQNEISLHMSAVIGGYSQSQDVTDKLSTAEQIAKEVPILVANCRANRGTPVELATPAGTFKTCKIEIDQSQKIVTVWYADVVFGFAKKTNLVRASGVAQTMLLQSFKNGGGQLDRVSRNR